MKTITSPWHHPMRVHTLICGLVAFGLCTISSSAQAVSIPIVNADFQSVFNTGTAVPVVIGPPASNANIRATNAFGTNITLGNPNTQVDTTGWVNVSGQSGIENLGSKNLTGNTVGYNTGVNNTITGYVGVFNTSPASFRQTLSSNLLANQIYTLSVEVFRRNDQPSTGAGATNFPLSFAATLLAGPTYGTSTVLTATGSPTYSTPATGTMATYSISFDTALPANASLVGQPISIRFSTATGQVNLDNVVLTAVPEPGTFAMLLFGAIGMWLIRTKR